MSSGLPWRRTGVDAIDGLDVEIARRRSGAEHRGVDE